MKRNERGFSILELLMVVAIIGILAAIVMANYFTAITRARQKRTMADMRSIGIGWEARATEVRAYTAAGATYTIPALELDTAAMGVLLVPTYVKVLPVLDAWGRPYEFYTDVTPNGKTYAIRSSGSDGVFNATSYLEGPTDSPDCDIVYSQGSFITYPQVPQ